MQFHEAILSTLIDYRALSTGAMSHPSLMRIEVGPLSDDGYASCWPNRTPQNEKPSSLVNVERVARHSPLVEFISKTLWGWAILRVWIHLVNTADELA